MLALLLLLAAPLEPAAERTELIAEWESWRYGMFIHYGMSTFTGREIDPGDAPSTTYAPTALDVRQWVRTAREAGMKYAVLTAKHVAGHCLWDTAADEYDVATATERTDVVAEFVAACAAEGIAPGLYYCVLDGHHEGGVKWQEAVGPDYFALIVTQLTELHERYPGIREQWIDIPGKLSPEQRRELYELVKELSPDCLVIMNQGFRDAVTVPDYGWPTDLLNGERTVPPAPHEPHKVYAGRNWYLPMEVCETIGANWFWQPDDPPRPVRALWQLYQRSVGRGANLLLNVPPDRTGRIPQEHVEALLALKRLIDDPPATDAEPVSQGAMATASNVFQNQAQWDPKLAVDGDWNSRWATDHGLTAGWLELDLGAPKTFAGALISEGWDRARRWELQVRRGEAWVTVASGERIGRELELRFAPVTAQQVRLMIHESTNGPTIWELQLYGP